MIKPRLLLLVLCAWSAPMLADPLGLPAVPVPSDNPQSPAKIALGKKLFNDMRFSSTGKVSCATCHNPQKAFTDSPLKVSEGINKLKGTRNAPTVINAAFNHMQFWDGRSVSLEDQSQHPMVNPVEMGLKDHSSVVRIVQTDPEYIKMFQTAFGKSGAEVGMPDVMKAIASFERTVVAGDSPFDRYYFRGETGALTPAQVRGFKVFLNEGRCVSCHAVEETQALFTDNRFHNIGIGINGIQKDVPPLALQFLSAKAKGADVDKKVLTDKRSSELGRFAVTDRLDDMGSFKTPTLRNIAVTAPYMHDGSLKTLKEVVVHYNNGGVTKKGQHVNDYLSGGIRPLNLTDQQIADLVSFMESLTSPQFAKTAKTASATR